MTLRKGGGKPSVAGPADSLSEGDGASGGSSPTVDQLSHGVADISLDSAQDGEWEVYTRKSKNRAGSSAGKSWVTPNGNPKAWGRPDGDQMVGSQNSSGPGKVPENRWPTTIGDSRRPAGGGNSRPQSSSRGFDNNYVASQAAITPPLEHGWNWHTRTAATQSSEDGTGRKDIQLDDHDDDGDKIDSDEDSDDVDTDDELLTEFDSDASEKSHDSKKRSKWFKAFFEILDKLTVEEINEPSRQWHCPACKGGPGEIDWYRGLGPLMTHAKTKGSKRVILHREFAELLDEELRRRGTSVIPSGESFGKWKGLKEIINDREIVWPPMVVIVNTKLELGENDKWIGMGNQELLDYFSSYAAEKARHSYGPQGHRGMSVLIFESSAMGFLEAERLHNHFREQGLNREAWDHHPVPFCPGGKRQLYGYMAEKQDLEFFNQYCQGKQGLKFEMRSYEEKVVTQMKQMNEVNQDLSYYKNTVAKVQRHKKALEENLEAISKKLRKIEEENRIVRRRSKMHHEQNKEEMDFQEQFFNDQLKIIHEARDKMEDNFEKLQQEQREKVKQSNSNLTTTEDQRSRGEEVAKFITIQEKEMEGFVAERDGLMKTHEDRRVAMKLRHWEEEVALERVFDEELNRLMKKFTPQLSDQGSNNLQ